MALLGGFFKKYKIHRFEYKPRHWDPNKEDLQQRLKAAQGRSDNSPEALKQRISANLRRSYQSKSTSNRSASLKSTLMLLAIIGVLVIFAYYMLIVYLPVLEKSIGN